MSRIFECLGEFGLVEYQYALLDYYYKETIIHDINEKKKELYLNWIETLRDDAMRRGYLKLVRFFAF